MLPSKTKKMLTPLMTSMVLICIAIAISFATLAWINGLPTSIMYTEELQLTSLQWGPNCTYVDITLFNNGTRSVKLSSVTVNSKPVTVIYVFGSSFISIGESTLSQDTGAMGSTTYVYLTGLSVKYSNIGAALLSMLMPSSVVLTTTEPGAIPFYPFGWKAL